MIYLVQLCNNPTNIELRQLPKKSLSLVLVWTVWHCQDPTQFKEGQWKWYENCGPSSVVLQAHSHKLISHKLWSPPKKHPVFSSGPCLVSLPTGRTAEHSPLPAPTLSVQVTLPTHHCLDPLCLCRSPLHAHSLSLKPKVPFTDNTKLSPLHWQYKAISPLLTIQSYLPFTDNTKLSPLYWQYKAITES